MSQISGAASIDSAITNAPANRFSELESEDFLRIIFTELTNQDPLQPNDTNALLEQLNSIRSIESDIQLGNQLEALVTENQLASASNLLGKVITGRTADFDLAEGVVVGVRREADEVQLELEDGTVVPYRNIQSVVQPESPVDPGALPIPPASEAGV